MSCLVSLLFLFLPSCPLYHSSTTSRITVTELCDLDSITRQHRECKARNMDFTFDAEAICGVKLTTSAGFLVAAATTTSNPTAATVTVTAAADSTTTGDSKSSTASGSNPSAASLTSTQEASSTGNQTSSASSTPTPTNGAPGKGAIGKVAMVLVGVYAVVLC